MKTALTAALSAAVISVSFGVAAQTRPADDAPPEAISRYMVGTRLGYITCSNKYRDYVDKWERFALVNEGQTTVTGTPPSDDDYRECVQETLVKGRNMYGPASKLSLSTPGKAVLKEYQTTWESSLTALGRPGGNEKARDYRTRQSKVQARLDELQRKVEAQAK
ncbi:MAG: hypothetical protein ACRECQ_16430 [Burkholderiaceae bacterium]